MAVIMFNILGFIFYIFIYYKKNGYIEA